MRSSCTGVAHLPVGVTLRSYGCVCSAGSSWVIISWPARVMSLTAMVRGGSGVGKGWERSPVSALRALGSSFCRVLS